MPKNWYYTLPTIRNPLRRALLPVALLVSALALFAALAASLGLAPHRFARAPDRAATFAEQEPAAVNAGLVLTMTVSRLVGTPGNETCGTSDSITIQRGTCLLYTSPSPRD